MNRQTVRGRQLTLLVHANRQTRGGSRGDKATGIAARRDAEQLMDRWTADDRKANDGRGRMLAVAFIRLRRANGYETVI